MSYWEMWKYLQYGFVVLFVSTVLTSVLGQNNYFEHPEDTKQFLRSTILDIIQDHHGFIWVATTDGLGRYDGKTVIEYRNKRSDTTTLSHNYALRLCEDKNGQIWVATKYGLNCFHPETGQFTRYIYRGTEKKNEKNYVLSVIEDRRGFIWYSTYYGVFRLNPQTREVMHFLADPINPSSIIHDVVWDIYESKNGVLWLATNAGISLYPNDDSFQFLNIKSGSNQYGLENDRIYTFSEQPNGAMWVGTNNGMYRVISKENNLIFTKYKHHPKHSNSLSSNFINRILTVGDDRIWVGTWSGGLNRITLPNNTGDVPNFSWFQNDPDDKRSISANEINAILYDRSGILWVGTSSGLDKYSPALSKFRVIRHKRNDSLSLSNNIVKSQWVDHNGNLWIGTRNGLNVLTAENLAKGHYQFRIFTHDSENPNSISHNNIFGMTEDRNGILWICTYNGLNYIDLNQFDENMVFHKITVKNGLPSNWVFNIEQIDSSTYWVATYRGLSQMEFDPNLLMAKNINTFTMDSENEHSLVNSFTYQVSKDRYGHFWIATFLGLSKWLDNSAGFENYLSIPDDTSSISDNSIICLFKDSKGRMWVGTRNGLNYIRQKSKNKKATFKTFGIPNGFPNNVIQSIEEDANGKLWIGTNRGLVHFDPDMALQNKKSVIRYYNQHDGLKGAGFVFRSSYRDVVGTLYFGTADGLIYFNPEKLKQNPNAPPIVFTRLKILNKPVIPSADAHSVLKKSILYTDTIELSYWQNMINIEFAALDFTNPYKNQYQYKLEGFDNKWVDNQNHTSATYTNIPPGDYTFKVKASNNDGVWTQNPASLFIHISAPWWKTKWAYWGYVMAFAGMIYAFINFRINQKVNEIKIKEKIKATRLEERERLREKNAADFHDELGHRLTKVSLYLELAERKAKNDSVLLEILSKIKVNTSGLSDGIRDMIWSLDPKKDTIYETLIRLQEFGGNLFDYTEICFKSEPIDEKLHHFEIDPAGRKHILLIFKEAMNNCLKYSRAQNAVLSSKIDENNCIIIFKDDGIGFEPNSKVSGYGIKNMRNRAKKINAQLVIHVAQNKGVEVILDFCFTPEKIPPKWGNV